jgi:hypothetical protein
VRLRRRLGEAAPLRRVFVASRSAHPRVAQRAHVSKVRAHTSGATLTQRDSRLPGYRAKSPSLTIHLENKPEKST